MIEDIFQKAEEGKRINPEEGLFLLKEADVLEIGAVADMVRRRFHPNGRRGCAKAG